MHRGYLGLKAVGLEAETPWRVPTKQPVCAAVFGCSLLILSLPLASHENFRPGMFQRCPTQHQLCCWDILDWPAGPQSKLRRTDYCYCEGGAAMMPLHMHSATNRPCQELLWPAPHVAFLNPWACRGLHTDLPRSPGTRFRFYTFFRRG